MTDQSLRELLRERVADEQAPDLSGAAWTAGRRLRRRRAGVVVAGAAAAVLAVAGGSVAVLGDDPGSPEPAPPVTSPTAPPTSPEPSPPPDDGSLSREPDATYQGVPIWWSPDQAAERELPEVDSQLPPTIDLAAQAIGTPEYATAAFAVGDRVLLTAPNAGQVSVDISFLDGVTKPNGYVLPPTHAAMLSPTGRYLVFPQDGSVQVYTVATETWREIDTGDRTTRFVTWSSDESFVLPPRYGGIGDAFDVRGQPAGHLGWPVPDPGFGTGEAVPYGRLRTSPVHQAQTWYGGPPLPLPDSTYGEPADFVSVVRSEGDSVALALLNEVGDGTDVRWKGCCSVATWLDDDVVVYESRQDESLLVSWRVGTDEFGLVTRIVGSYDVASYPRLWQDLADVPY